MAPEPPPLEIRPATLADVDVIAAIHVNAWRETYRGLLPDSLLDQLSIRARAEQWRRALDREAAITSVFVAAPVTGEPIGFVAGGPRRGATTAAAAEVYALYVLQRAQRRGIGRRLMLDLSVALRERGFTSLGLWVLSSNWPARRFYERLGGVVGDQRVETMAGHALAEVAYGWDSLAGVGAPVPTP